MYEQTNFFDINKLKLEKSFYLCLLGSSGCGKTTLLKYILEEFKGYFTLIFLLLGSDPSEDNIYSNFVWPSHIKIFDNLNKKKEIQKTLDDIKKLADSITKINITIKDENKKNHNQISSRPIIRTLFIVDDFGSELQNFSHFGNVGRHSNFYFIFLIHNDTDLSKEMRKKINYYFIQVNYNSHMILGESRIENINSQIKEYKINFEKNSIRNPFVVLDIQHSHLYYYFLTQEQVDETKFSISVLYTFSNEKLTLINSLKSLIAS